MVHQFLSLTSFTARFTGYAVAVYLTYQLGEPLYPCYALVLGGETLHAAGAVMTWRAVQNSEPADGE